MELKYHLPPLLVLMEGFNPDYNSYTSTSILQSIGLLKLMVPRTAG